MEPLPELVRYLEQYGPWHWQYDGLQRVKGLCLFHQERTPSLKVMFSDPDDVFAYCYGCHVSFDLLGAIWLLEFEGKPLPRVWVAAKERYRQITGRFYRPKQKVVGPGERKIVPIQGDLPPVRLPRPANRKPVHANQVQVLEIAFQFWHRQLFANNEEARAARAYLVRRGLDLEFIAAHPRHFGYAPSSAAAGFAFGMAQGAQFGPDWAPWAIDMGLLTRPDRRGRSYFPLRGRVMFACHRMEDDAIAFFQGRAIAEGQTPKYYNATLPRIPFWLPVSEPVRPGTIIVEGSIEVTSLAQNRLRAVGQLGTDSNILPYLSLYPQPIFRGHNNDEPRPGMWGWMQPGEEQAEQLRRDCQSLGIESYRLLPPRVYKDYDLWIRQEGIAPVLAAIDRVLETGKESYRLSRVS